MDVLACAYAEIGDFASAVRQEMKAIAITTNDPQHKRWRSDRLKLFNQSKPYRMIGKEDHHSL
jgi:ABC-type xylose transport system substrate-binding protein